MQNDKNIKSVFSFTLSRIIHCRSPNHIEYIVLIKSNSQMTLFTQEKEEEKRNCRIITIVGLTECQINEVLLHLN